MTAPLRSVTEPRHAFIAVPLHVVPESVTQAISEALKDQRLIICTDDGTRLSDNVLWLLLRDIANKACERLVAIAEGKAP